MQNPLSRLLPILGIVLLALGFRDADAERIKTLESEHFVLLHEKKHAQLAGEILQVAESVWPTLAKAYESYEHYQKIDILVIDQTDDANGFAIYQWNQVAIFAPHMDWVLRNRQIWLRNVVTHELAHVFSLRRAARLSPFDWVDVTGRTYNARDRINFSFSLPWVPLIAPNWYVEGIAQFEAEQNGNDKYDSQRDMLLRDAYLTGTLPSLDYIETFDRSEDWIQGERVYNTGYAFLLYLKDRFGVDKVRQLAFHKPLFNFSSSFDAAFGQGLPELFEAFKRSLADKYADFKELPVDALADPAMPGSYQQNLVFSSDGKYQAWLGNDESRRFPANWIYWKPLLAGNGEVKKSAAPSTPPPAEAPKDPKQPDPNPPGLVSGAYGSQSIPGFTPFRSAIPTLGLGARYQSLSRPGEDKPSPSRMIRRNHDADRSEELGSEGLEFNCANKRLLTTRQDYEYSTYTDLWEYEFLANRSEKDKWHRLTWEERASYPSYHPFENRIVFVRKKAGSTNLAVLDSTGRIGQLTNFSGGQQVYNPRFNPKGDSIYFTLQVEDKEAIAVISAKAQPFNSFASLKDSALFPDSSNMAKDQRLVLMTPLREGAIRHLRFAGDTLLWSSNMHDSGYSVYNVYARIPGDSLVQRATQVRTQALEPLVHDGKLYYQGFQRQRFLIFQRPLAFTPVGPVLAPTVDSLLVSKPKKVDYGKAFETDEYGGRRIAHEIVPFLSVQPQFIDNNRSYTDVALGLAVNIGDPLGNWYQSFSAAIAKRADLRTPLNYQLSYSGYLAYPSIQHTRMSWSPVLQYSFYHDIVQSEDVINQTDYFFQGADSIGVKAKTSLSFKATRDFISTYFPLPYDFVVDGSFFRQVISQDYTQQVVFTNGTTGGVISQNTPFTNYLADAPQHRNFNSGLGWGHSWMKLGTYLPTGVGVWGAGRKWWATYQTGFMDADSLLKQTLSQQGKPAPQLVLLQGEFDPWSLELGAGGIWSYRKLFSAFANVQAASFLNKFPTTNEVADISGNDSTFREETVGTLWAMTYQLGYSQMPGYPYNFRYRGRDIMEGTSFAKGSYGIEIPIRLGAFLPGLPITSFRQFSVTAMGDLGTTLITPADKLYDALEQGQHYLLLDFGVKLSANFRIYHQYPFTIYGLGFVPYNRLSADRLFWNDYPHRGRSVPDGSHTAEQIANAPQDRAEYIKLVKDPRYFVGFQLGF